MRIDAATWIRRAIRRTVVVAAYCLVLPAVGHAQTPEQQVVNDAAAALGVASH